MSTDMQSKIIKEMIDYNGGDTRRINHAMKVYALTKCIVESETNDAFDIESACIAAILHDIGIHKCEEKYGSAAGKYQQTEGPPIAREMLKKHSVNNNIIDRVCYLIAHHHTYTNIDGADYQALVEADFIVNLDEEKSSEDAILAALKNIFKTDTGKSILNTMLL